MTEGNSFRMSRGGALLAAAVLLAAGAGAAWLVIDRRAGEPAATQPQAVTGAPAAAPQASSDHER